MRYCGNSAQDDFNDKENDNLDDWKEKVRSSREISPTTGESGSSYKL